MRFSRTNMRLAAARCRSLSRKIGVQTAEFSITAFCWRNADSRKSRTYERHNAEIRLELFNLSQETEAVPPGLRSRTILKKPPGKAGSTAATPRVARRAQALMAAALEPRLPP